MHASGSAALVPLHKIEAYDAALAKLAPEAAKQVHLVYERVAQMWRNGVRLHAMAQELGIHRDRIMEIVAALELPDRCPATCNPLSLMQTQHYPWPVPERVEDPADYGSWRDQFPSLFAEVTADSGRGAVAPS